MPYNNIQRKAEKSGCFPILMEEIHVGDEMKVNLLRNIIENVD